MKKCLLLLALLFAVAATSTYAQDQVLKKVMVEQFTQASCPPCAVYNPDFNQVMFGLDDEVVTLKYQTSFPGFDPMNLHNPDEVLNRRNYYGVTSVPSTRVGGATPPSDGTFGAGHTALVDNAYMAPLVGDSTPIKMVVDHELSADLSEITINVDVINLGNTAVGPTNGRLRVALVEKELLFPFPPGSTDEQDFYSVMRKMYPNDLGTFLAAIPAGDTASFSWTEPVPDYIYVYDQIGVVAFWQDEATLDILQSEESLPKALPGDFADVAIESATQAPDGLCDYTMTPALEVTNNSSVEVTSFDVAYIANGVATEESWSGSLMPGMSTTFDFSEYTLDDGASTQIEYEVVNVNGGLDVNGLNELLTAENYVTFSDVPAQNGEYEEGFEATAFAETPPGMILLKEDRLDLAVVAANNISNPPPPDPAGGYGNSNKSILVWYWGNSVGEDFEMIVDKTSLDGFENAQLTFDRAYAQFQTTNDAVEIFISTDCGDTWTSVYQNSGADMATAPPSSSFFYPTPNQWETDTVDLSAFDGASEIVVRFYFLSDFGNNMYIDNVNITSDLVTSVNTPQELDGEIGLFPNPTSEYAYIDFSLTESTEVNVEVYDVNGRMVERLLDGAQFPAGKHQARWDITQQSGVYFVKIRTQTGEVNKRVVVTR